MNRRSPPPTLLRLAAALAATLACLDFAAPAGAVADGPRISRAPALQRAVTSAINDLRAEHGLPRLARSPGLARAALRHARELGQGGYFSHDSPDGSSFTERIAGFYPPRASQPWAWSVGEDLLWTGLPFSADSALARWLASPQHEHTLLGASWRDFGVAVVRVTGAPGVFGGDDVTIAVVDFGVR